jgi:hypothetical protein
MSRIYRGMHHPLDVAMGLLLGVGCMVVAAVAVRAWVGRWWEPRSEGGSDERKESAVDSGDSGGETLERRLAG